MTDPAAAPSPESASPPSRPRSPLGRRAVAVTATFLTGLLIWHAGVVVYRDSYAMGTPSPLDVNCSTGIRRLHAELSAVWEARRTQRDPDLPVSPATDQNLKALRALCEREGEAATTAYEHFERWRYRADGQTHLWNDVLAEDARRALDYQSR